MQRWFFFLYGLGCYLLFLATYAVLAAFVGDVLLSKTISTPSGLPIPLAVAINLGLVGLFGVQHSVMARPGFKSLWTRLVPKPIERSTYVLASCVALALLMWQWRGIDVVIWHVESPILRTAIWILFAAGWLMVPAVSLLIDHFDLFGLRQVWLHLRGREYVALPFRVPGLYKHVRHPLYIGWGIAFWAIPTMTVGHLLFALLLTGYMAMATVWEERDLLAHFGRRYADYARTVPRFVPRLTAAVSHSAESESSTAIVRPVPRPSAGKTPHAQIH